MSVIIIGVVVFALILFSVLVSLIGYISFTRAFINEYAESTYRMADTATTLVKGDLLNAYLNDEYTEEYATMKKYLDTYCTKMNVTMMYIIVVDQSDYGRFTCVVESVNNSVDNTDYKEWPKGYQRNTTNEEYRSKYVNIYENGSAYETVYRARTKDGQKPHITTMVPIKGEDGKVKGLLCVHQTMRGLDLVRIKYMATIGLTALGLVILSAAFYAIFLKKKFMSPITKVSEEATRFAKESTKGEPIGAISRFKEIRNLAESIDTMETEMMNYIDTITAATAEKERMVAELSVASIIQESSIPSVFPAFPVRKDFDIFASMVPAKEVGGDFYNFFLIDDDHLAFVIGDVSGKGIPAALFMMVTNILITERTRMGGTPAEILSFVNDNVCEHNQADMFVTIWLGILEISTGKVTAANAGHDDAIVYRKNGEFDYFKTKHGVVVGAMKGVKYRNFEIQLEKGDKIFLYTDGVPEATNGDKELFNLKRTLETLNEYKEGSPFDIIKGVGKIVDAFVGEAPQFDDITMLCIEVKGKQEEGKTLTVDATTDNLAQVTDFIDAFLEENDCSPKNQMKIDLSVEEIFANIANYAYGEETGKAEVILKKEGDSVVITFKDGGSPYDPLAKADPDVTLSAEERNIGGLGIFLVKKNMDEVSYSYEGGKNVLTIKKVI